MAVKSKMGYCLEARKGPEHQQPRPINFHRVKENWHKSVVLSSGPKYIYLYGENYTSQYDRPAKKLFP